MGTCVFKTFLSITFNNTVAVVLDGVPCCILLYFIGAKSKIFVDWFRIILKLILKILEKKNQSLLL